MLITCNLTPKLDFATSYLPAWFCFRLRVVGKLCFVMLNIAAVSTLNLRLISLMEYWPIYQQSVKIWYIYIYIYIVRVVKSRRMRWAGHGAYGAGERGAQGSGGETWGKETTGETQTQMGDNIKMDPQEVGEGCEDWLELAQEKDRWRALVSTVMNLRVPKMRGISWLAAEPVRFSRRTLLHWISKYIYRVSQEEWTKVRESVPYVELYRYNSKYLYPKLNGYGDNDHRKVWASGVSTYCKPSVAPYSSTAHARQRETTS